MISGIFGNPVPSRLSALTLQRTTAPVLLIQNNPGDFFTELVHLRSLGYNKATAFSVGTGPACFQVKTGTEDGDAFLISNFDGAILPFRVFTGYAETRRADIFARNAAAVPLTLNLAASQTGLAFAVRDSADALLSGISQTGLMFGRNGAVSPSAANLVVTGNVFRVSGTTTITSVDATGIQPGTIIVLIFDGALTVTDGGNLRLNGNFVTTADDTLTLVWNGTAWFEVARSAN